MNINSFKEIAGLVLENALESQFYVQTLSQLCLCKALHLNTLASLRKMYLVIKHLQMCYLITKSNKKCPYLNLACKADWHGKDNMKLRNLNLT